jgi:putative toxin-antitoxin system antitoxin component (TIGR02293 family)
MTTTSPRYQNAQDLSRRLQFGKGTIRRILGISESTQSRYEKNNPILKPAIADRLSRFQRLSQQALDLFEDEAEAQSWLSTPKASLDGQTPLDALATDGGAQRGEELFLGRVDCMPLVAGIPKDPRLSIPPLALCWLPYLDTYTISA